MDDPRDSGLTWVQVTHSLLGDLDVGVVYDAEIPARPTSTYTYVTTGNPGDPGEEAMCEVLDVRETCVSDQSLMRLLSDAALDDLACLALDAIEARQAEEAEA